MISLSVQQVSSYAQNGFLELEGLLSPADCEKYRALVNPKRDNWRDSPVLKNLVTSRKLTHIAFQATSKNSLRLALDHWFPAGFSLPNHTPIKDLFCIQTIHCAIFIQLDPGHFSHTTAPSLGLLPFPKAQGNALLIQPHILLNWPPANLGLYLVAYSLPTAVFINNARDPSIGDLKRLGYSYGDTLTSESHPLLTKS